MAKRFRLPLKLLAVLVLGTAEAASTTWRGGAVPSGRRGKGCLVGEGSPWAVSDRRATEGGERVCERE